MAPRHISYRLMRRRIRRTLYYGQNSRIDRLSLPLSEMTVDYFDRNSPYDSLDMQFATSLSREGAVDPCTLIVAMVYLDRLRLNDKLHFEASDPEDLYLAALLIAGKYLQDNGIAEFVYNDEWAASASKSLKYINKVEVKILASLNWDLLVRPIEFDDRLRLIETEVARKAIQRRAFTTYSELRVLSDQFMTSTLIYQQFLQPLFTMIGLASLAYVSVVVSLVVGICHSRFNKLQTSNKLQIPSETVPRMFEFASTSYSTAGKSRAMEHLSHSFDCNFRNDCSEYGTPVLEGEESGQPIVSNQIDTRFKSNGFMHFRKKFVVNKSYKKLCLSSFSTSSSIPIQNMSRCEPIEK